MPVRVAIHAENCAVVQDGACTCTPVEQVLPEFADPHEAAAIHGGKPKRVKLLGIVRPGPVSSVPATTGRSQADRHRPISD